MTDLTERELILTALTAWISQRPGLEFGNYGDVSAYRSELRGITKDAHHARALLNAVWGMEGITAERLKAAFPRAFSGRLTWEPCTTKSGKPSHRLDYCTGQYWPTEYRRAACAVLASAIWDYWRDDYAARHAGDENPHHGAGDSIRKNAKLRFGKAIAERWFN